MAEQSNEPKPSVIFPQRKEEQAAALKFPEPNVLTSEQKIAAPLSALTNLEKATIREAKKILNSEVKKQGIKVDPASVKETLDTLNAHDIKNILSLDNKANNEKLVSTLLQIAAEKNYDSVTANKKTRELAFTTAIKIFSELSKNGRLSNHDDIKSSLAMVSISVEGSNSALYKLADQALLRIIKEDQKTDRKSEKLLALLSAALPDVNKISQSSETSRALEIIGDIEETNPKIEAKLVSFMNAKNAAPAVKAAAAYALIKSSSDEVNLKQATELIIKIRKENNLEKDPEVQRLTTKVNDYLHEQLINANKKK